MNPLLRPLPAERIRPGNTALLVIDMLDDFVREGAPLEVPATRAILPALQQRLATVVDDADTGVNQVVRGADLLFSTPRQMFL